MSSAFLRGMASINLFPKESNVSFSSPSSSINEALQNDWQNVGKDIYIAIDNVKKELPEECQ